MHGNAGLKNGGRAGKAGHRMKKRGLESQLVAEGEAFLRRNVTADAAGAVVTGACGAVAQL